MKLELIDMLRRALTDGCSDVYIVPGAPPIGKRGQELIPMEEQRLMPPDCETLLRGVYEIAPKRDMTRLLDTGDDDFSFSLRGVGRFRCNAYKQRGSLAAVLRAVPLGLPDPVKLGIPETVMRLYNKRRGLILVTGPAGSGKSTTLACMIDRINRECADHIITIEDPIEFLHPHVKSVVSQREIAQDTENYATALRAALRQAPDVILVGEMRDFETIQTVLTASETGHLVLSTLHTVGAAKTIDRIVDVFPPARQQQVRVQLSMVLSAVVSQQLIPSAGGGGMVPAFEIMGVSPAISNIIREGKIHQLDNAIYAGAQMGMVTMDASLARLYKEGKITRDDAMLYAVSPETLDKKL